jgi:twinkle protein
VTVLEGEEDALASFQMTGSQWPTVSVGFGAKAALEHCKAQYDWLNSFENIVVCFDSDAPGVEAAAAVAEMFGNKSKIVKHLSGKKDASDYLVAGDEKGYIKAWWAAEAYTPDGIINGRTSMTS